METDYEKQAQDFLTKTGATITAEYERTGKYFPDDKQERDVYKFTITRGTRSYTATFGQSIEDSGDIQFINPQFKARCSGFVAVLSDQKFQAQKETFHAIMGKDFKVRRRIQPTAYDILAAMTKSDPGTHEDFCSEYGYDVDSISGKAIYEAVRDEYLNLAKLFSDEELEAMSEIN